jgi:hypothetical protein
MWHDGARTEAAAAAAAAALPAHVAALAATQAGMVQAQETLLMAEAYDEFDPETMMVALNTAADALAAFAAMSEHGAPVAWRGAIRRDIMSACEQLPAVALMVHEIDKHADIFLAGVPCNARRHTCEAVCAAVMALLHAPRMPVAEPSAEEERALQRLAIRVVRRTLSVDCASAACAAAAAAACPLLLHLAATAGVEALQQRGAAPPSSAPSAATNSASRFNIAAVLTACVMQARMPALRAAALQALAALLATQLLAL